MKLKFRMCEVTIECHYTNCQWSRIIEPPSSLILLPLVNGEKLITKAVSSTSQIRYFDKCKFNSSSFNSLRSKIKINLRQSEMGISSDT